MSTALRHNAFVYQSPDEYIARAVAFLRAGLQVGEGGIVAHTRPGLAAMRDVLGPDAGRVKFVDVSAAYTRPAHTLASYHRVYVEQLRGVRSLRAVADVQLGPDPGEWDEWVGYESVFNRAFAHLRSIQFGHDLEEFREHLARALAAEQVPEAKALDMLVASTEIAANALTHGGGMEDVRVGRINGRFVCEIVDRGRGFDDPTAGYVPPREGIGEGLWVARQLTWRIELFQSPHGFTARIWL